MDAIRNVLLIARKFTEETFTDSQDDDSRAADLTEKGLEVLRALIEPESEDSDAVTERPQLATSSLN
jgi:hypothetical protein